MAANTRHEPPSVLREGLSQIPQLSEGGTEPDQGLRDLQVANITTAVALGVMAGDLAIRDVLSGGRLGVLGDKRQK